MAVTLITSISNVALIIEDRFKENLENLDKQFVGIQFWEIEKPLYFISFQWENKEIDFSFTFNTPDIKKFFDKFGESNCQVIMIRKSGYAYECSSHIC